jgi:hypothetical protein
MFNDYVYDLETYPNIWLCTIADLQERKIKVFEISTRKDQRNELFEYLRGVYKNKGRLIGFNNVFFDYPVLHQLLKKKNLSAKQLFEFADKVIKSGRTDDKWKYVVKDKDVMLPQIDLYKIWHFDNKAKATSLKMIEYNSRSEDIQDLPFEVGKYLTHSEMDKLIKYNIHDVKETIKFYEQSKSQISFREKLSQQYDFNALNWNDTKIGQEYFVMELEKSGVKCYDKQGAKQTHRPFIDLVDCIFPYVKFERPEFNAVLNWFKKQRITETKGVFSDIMEHELGEVSKYALMVTKKEKLKTVPTEEEIAEFKKTKPLCWIEEVQLKAKIPKKDGGGFKKSHYLCWNVAESLNVVVDGLCYVFGTGGLHGSLEKQVIVADDKYLIEDEDVSSFYPNLAIKNKIYPEHLSDKFCEVYEYLYNLRKTFDKKSAENAMLKLALNGVYGKSNDIYSPFYDPKFTMMITINGQLSLCMMVEQLLKLEGLQIIQANTDGITFKRKRTHDNEVKGVINWWQDITKLELERTDYNKMVIRDVNSYIAVKLDGSLKNKGAYEYKDLPHHKNQSALVIKMAAEKYLVEGLDPEEFIRNHKEKFDFQLRTKVPRSSKLVLVDGDGVDLQTQNICRYYISDKGMEMVKVMPPIDEFKEEQIWTNHELMDSVTISKKPDITRYQKKGYVFEKMVQTPCEDRRLSIEAGWKCKVTNNIKDFDWDINYQYYIERTWKLIDFAEVEEQEEDSENNV